MSATTGSAAETLDAKEAPLGPASTSEELRFLQERIALLVKVLSLLSAAGLVAVLALDIALKLMVHTWLAHVLHGVSIVITTSAWLYLRARPRPERIVKIADAAVTIAMALTMHLMCIYFPRQARPDLVAALITTLITLARAIIVPSSPRRTFVVSTLAWLPLFGACALVFSGPEAVLETNNDFILVESEVNTFIWGSNAVGLATIAARVIFGLRREVREAKKLGQYTLLDKLGEGGMGQVFRAQHAMLRRPTAVKLLHPRASGGAEDLARFEREVQLTAQLSHPNVVTVFDYGRTPDGVFYYAMELLDGENLEDVVTRTGPMTPARAVHVITQVASALAEAHAVGLIHRDVKPANIILCARGSALDVAKVVDFGLVKDIGGSSDPESTRIRAATTDEPDADAPQSSGVLSRTGTVLGTPMYLPPEAMRDPTSVDGRADLYALGAVAYFLLTGTPVFGGATVMEACRHHLHSKPEKPSQRLGAPIPEDLEAIVLRLLEKNPDDRVGSAAELVAELGACSVAGGWTNEDARVWWEHEKKGVGSRPPREDVSWSAKTIAVDLAR